jgi:hypothetical protein
MMSDGQDARPLPMADGDLHEEIVRLEAEIDELSGVLERSRKLGLMAKIAITVGAIWLLAWTLGAISSDPIALISALAAVIGGIVLFGSNASTAKQAANGIRAAEARRAELIDQINLRVVRQSGS